MTFYDDWLGAWDKAEAERRAARKVIHEHELAWVETAQDHRAALLIAPETGFRTMGTTTMLAEIPPGGHTGDHKHGEEAIYIVAGSGCSVISGTRYDWGPGSVLAVPFGARHQHFNLGDKNVRYFSILSVDLERFAGLHRTVQFSPHGTGAAPTDIDSSPDGLDPTGRRLLLSAGAASGPPPPSVGSLTGMAGEPSTAEQERSLLEGETLVVGDINGFHRFMHLHRNESDLTTFMRISQEQNGFAVHEQEISGIMCDPPKEYSGKHAHQEALLYILDGHGHSIIDNERVDWWPGSALHVTGPQTVHQHFVESDVPSRMLRGASGLRYFFEPAVKPEWPYLFISPRQAVVDGRTATAAETAG